MNWLWFALLAMVLFSFSNIILKVILSGFISTEKIPLEKFILAGGAVVVALAVIYLLFFRHINLASPTIQMIAAFIALGAGAFLFFVLAMREGKVALVAAALSLGTAVTAALTAFFFHEQFSLKEIGAMVLAVASVVLLAL